MSDDSIIQHIKDESHKIQQKLTSLDGKLGDTHSTADILRKVTDVEGKIAHLSTSLDTVTTTLTALSKKLEQSLPQNPPQKDEF